MENQYLPNTVTFIRTMILTLLPIVAAGNSGGKQAKKGAGILL